MTNPRKTHVAKSDREKELYRQMLKTQHSEDPTYEDYESSSTNTVSREKKDKSSITAPSLRPYIRETQYPVKEIFVGVIVFGITAILFLWGMSLNREIGVINERTNQIVEKVGEIRSDFIKVKDKVDGLFIDFKIISNGKINFDNKKNDQHSNITSK